MLHIPNILLNNGERSKEQEFPIFLQSCIRRGVDYNDDDDWDGDDDDRGGGELIDVFEEEGGNTTCRPSAFK